MKIDKEAEKALKELAEKMDSDDLDARDEHDALRKWSKNQVAFVALIESFEVEEKDEPNTHKFVNFFDGSRQCDVCGFEQDDPGHALPEPPKGGK